MPYGNTGSLRVKPMKKLENREDIYYSISICGIIYSKNLQPIQHVDKAVVFMFDYMTRFIDNLTTIPFNKHSPVQIRFILGNQRTDYSHKTNLITHIYIVYRL